MKREKLNENNSALSPTLHRLPCRFCGAKMDMMREREEDGKILSYQLICPACGTAGPKQEATRRGEVFDLAQALSKARTFTAAKPGRNETDFWRQVGRLV